MLRHLYYRGVLKSCNYQCSYCPFAKRQTSRAELAADQKALERFVSWVETTPLARPISVLFTPYGEGMIHPHYWEAFARLSRSENVAMVSAQTNLSFDAAQFLQALHQQGAQLEKVALWASWHPEMTSAQAFADKVQLLSQSIQITAGAVGDPARLRELAQLKRLLGNLPFWVNRMDGLGRRCTAEEKQAFCALDPLYRLEDQRFPADLSVCTGGTQSLFVEADGSVYPCNRSKQRLGNLYQREWAVPERCKGKCDCFLAYANRKDLLQLAALLPYPQLRLKCPKPKAYFFDLDGTLLDADGRCTPEKQAMLAQLAQESALYLATARPYADAMRRCGAARKQFAGGVFGYGSELRDFRLEREVYQFLPPLPEGISVQRVYQKGGQPYKLTLQRLSLVPEGFCCYEEGGVWSLVAQGVSKWSGVQRICDWNGWQPTEIFVVGDGPADVEMLAACPCSAAPSDACLQAKQAARFILEFER